MSDATFSGLLVTGLESDADRKEAEALASQLQALQGGGRRPVLRIPEITVPQGFGDLGDMFAQESIATRQRLQDLVGPQIPGFELEAGSTLGFRQGFLTGQPNRELITEEASVLSEIFGIPSEDIVLLEASDETGDQDIIFIRNPDTGKFRQFTQQGVLDMAKAGRVAALFITAESMAELGIELIGTKGVGSGVRFLAANMTKAALASVFGDQFDLMFGRMLGIEEMTLEESLDPDRIATTAAFGAGGQSVAEVLNIGIRRATLARDEFKGIKDINIEAKEFGLSPISSAEAGPAGRSLARQSAATTVRGRASQEDRMARILKAIQRELSEQDTAELSTRALGDFVKKRIKEMKSAVRAKLTVGRGPASVGRSLIKPSEAFDEVLDEVEDRAFRKVAEGFKANNLSIDLDRGRQEVMDIARGKVVVGRPEGDPLVFFDQPSGELKELVEQYLSLGGKQTTISFDGRLETHPVEILGTMHRKARRLLGGGDATFNDAVESLVAVLDDVLRNPIRGAQGEAVPAALRGIVEPVRGLPRGAGGRFAPEQIPEGFSSNVDEYLDIVATNTSTREAMVVRIELERAIKRGSLDQFGRTLIDPRKPERITQTMHVLRASGMEDKIQPIIDGYRLGLLELDSSQIDRILDRWVATSSKEARNAVMPEGVAENLRAYARNQRMLESSVIARVSDQTDILTRGATLELLTDTSGGLARAIKENGGAQGPLARSLRFNILTDLINESEVISATGRSVIDPAILTRKIRQLQDSGNLEVLFPGREGKFLDFLPRYIAALPGVPGMGEGLLAAQIAQGSAQFLIPTPIAIMKTISARGKAIRNAMFAFAAYNRWVLGASVRSLGTPQAVLRSVGVGAAAQLRQHEQDIKDLIDSKILEPSDPIVVDMQQGEQTREFQLPGFLQDVLQ